MFYEFQGQYLKERVRKREEGEERKEEKRKEKGKRERGQTDSSSDVIWTRLIFIMNFYWKSSSWNGKNCRRIIPLKEERKKMI